MATIDDKSLIDKIIANNGYYEDDPQVYMIVEYINAWDNQAYGITWSNEPNDRKERYLVASEYIRNPKVIWKANENSC